MHIVYNRTIENIHTCMHAHTDDRHIDRRIRREEQTSTKHKHTRGLLLTRTSQSHTCFSFRADGCPKAAGRLRELDVLPHEGSGATPEMPCSGTRHRHQRQSTWQVGKLIIMKMTIIIVIIILAITIIIIVVVVVVVAQPKPEMTSQKRLSPTG